MNFLLSFYNCKNYRGTGKFSIRKATANSRRMLKVSKKTITVYRGVVFLILLCAHSIIIVYFDLLIWIVLVDLSDSVNEIYKMMPCFGTITDWLLIRFFFHNKKFILIVLMKLMLNLNNTSIIVWIFRTNPYLKIEGKLFVLPMLF